MDNPSPQVVKVAVEDQGIGISALKADELFQHFNRLGKEQTNIQGGGLGLTICKNYVELMQGEIGYQTAEGQGSTFWFTLPRSASSVIAPTEHGPVIAKTVEQASVLYVEDIDSNIALMQSICSDIARISLHTATTGKQALQIIADKSIHLIMLDYKLPDMNAFQLIEKIRALPNTAQIPIVAITANAEATFAKKALQSGFNQVLTKPIVVEEIMSLLQSILRD